MQVTSEFAGIGKCLLEKKSTFGTRHELMMDLWRTAGRIYSVALTGARPPARVLYRASEVGGGRRLNVVAAVVHILK